MAAARLRRTLHPLISCAQVHEQSGKRADGSADSAGEEGKVEWRRCGRRARAAVAPPERKASMGCSSRSQLKVQSAQRDAEANQAASHTAGPRLIIVESLSARQPRRGVRSSSSAAGWCVQRLHQAASLAAAALRAALQAALCAGQSCS